MGVSIFVCRVRTEEDVLAAIECMREHNSTEVVPIERSEDDVARLDPKRHKVNLSLRAQFPGMVSTGFGQHNRGGDIEQTVAFVKFIEHVWLEFSHKSGGACTTDWLEKSKDKYPSLVWFGTRGKPDGFIEAP